MDAFSPRPGVAGQPDGPAVLGCVRSARECLMVIDLVLSARARLALAGRPMTHHPGNAPAPSDLGFRDGGARESPGQRPEAPIFFKEPVKSSRLAARRSTGRATPAAVGRSNVGHDGRSWTLRRGRRARPTPTSSAPNGAAGAVGGGVQHVQHPPVVSEKPPDYVSTRGAGKRQKPSSRLGCPCPISRAIVAGAGFEPATFGL